MNDLWLPEGHHWDLHIEHDRQEDAGAFTGGGWKLCWHTTESSWNSVDAMCDVLRSKRAAPHFVIGGRPGVEHPVVVQLLPLDRAGRALANDSSDGFQTNRANVIQVEICGRTSEIPGWPDLMYKRLANLTELVMHRVDIPNSAPRDFSNPVRMSDSEWVAAKGYVGHCHAPDNDHVDPSRFREGFLIDLVRSIRDGGYDL